MRVIPRKRLSLKAAYDLIDRTLFSSPQQHLPGYSYLLGIVPCNSSHLSETNC